MSDEEPKLIAIDEEANHQIVHGDRFGKANGATYKPFNPGPQIGPVTVWTMQHLGNHGPPPQNRWHSSSTEDTRSTALKHLRIR